MQEGIRPLREYAKAISANLSRGDATEHTHRPALKALMDSFQDIVATNEPKRIDAGAPDYIITTGVSTIGYIEAKDVGDNLTKIERTDQLKRYLAALPNLILTDYVEFRWYTDGQLRESARLGMIADSGVRTTAESLGSVSALLENFLSHRVPGVATPRDLAVRMGHMARLIYRLTTDAFGLEEETGSLHSQHKSFKEVLLPELTVEQFADMYTQTIAYGLFAARAQNPSGAQFTRQSAAFLLPKTNPFLRKLFGHIAGVELADEIAWAVDDLAQILDDADMPEILRDFGSRTRKEDPVVHFYETFLSEYNPKMREMRGVYYTPEPVVSYIVRSVDHLLQTKFGKPLGLADPSVLILDPACGTGTFLFYVVKLIYDRMVETGQKGSWNSYVETKLLPRLFGFELLMAPYAIAHLKLGLLLEELGYKPTSDRRLEIYLTNTLEEAAIASETLGFAGYITEEANAASEIKRDKPIMVVLGNPPYSLSSANKGEWITNLVQEYKSGLEEKKQNIGDDFIKFIRFGQWRIDQSGHGILAFITNNTYISGITHRRMRESLMKTFSNVWILDLHGSAKKREVSPSGKSDDNVFDIQQGVAISLFEKQQEEAEVARVHFAELWGERDAKYGLLAEQCVETTDWLPLSPASEHFFFVPRIGQGKDEYSAFTPLLSILTEYISGVQTKKDALFVGFTPDEISSRMTPLLSESITDERIVAESWILRKAKKATYNKAQLRRYMVASLDNRWIYYDPNLLGRARFSVMKHMLVPNIGLVFMRQNTNLSEYDSFLAVNGLVSDRVFYSAHGAPFLSPLYTYSDKDTPEGTLDLDTSPWPLSDKGRRPNLNPAFVDDLKAKLGMEFITDGKGDLTATFGPEDIFAYIYAVFHSPTYRSRYAEFLKIDFPRVPLTSDPGLFRALAAKGSELVSLHLMESPALNNLITTYPVQGTDIVEKVEYQETLRRVKINKDQYFEGIGQDVWEFHIGGYQVMQKWLKDRKGRVLSYEDQQHYQKIAVALTNPYLLMAEMDQTIPNRYPDKYRVLGVSFLPRVIGGTPVRIVSAPLLIV